jgi:hypothetical protein
MSNLDKAAAELDSAHVANEKRAGETVGMHSGQLAEARQVIAEVNDRRMEIATGYTRLAAIQAGLPFPVQPDPGQETP